LQGRHEIVISANQRLLHLVAANGQVPGGNAGVEDKEPAQTQASARL